MRQFVVPEEGRPSYHSQKKIFRLDFDNLVTVAPPTMGTNTVGKYMDQTVEKNHYYKTLQIIFRIVLQLR